MCKCLLGNTEGGTSTLFIPYLPFARQDRVMVDGEPLSVKVMADLINSCGFDNVTIYDPHSEVCLALINNAVANSNHNFVKKVLHGKSNYYIVSPDAGAYKKIFKLCQSINYTERIALCNKTRNVATGEMYQNAFSGTIVKVTDIYFDTVEYQRNPVNILIHENSTKTRSISSFTKPIHVFTNCYVKID